MEQLHEGRDDVVRLEDERYYILADSSYTDDRVQVLHLGETFGVFDRLGDVDSLIRSYHGIFHEGTRHLSMSRLLLDGRRPLLLSSNVKEQNDLLSIDLGNPRLVTPYGTIEQGVIHIARSKCILEGACCEEIRIKNFDLLPHAFSISLSIGADYQDIFEVRGATRAARGAVQSPEVFDGRRLVHSYHGLDGVLRITELCFETGPTQLRPGVAHYELRLEPQQEVRLCYSMVFSTKIKLGRAIHFDTALKVIRPHIDEGRAMMATVTTSNTRFNNWLSQSMHDLVALLAPTPYGRYPFAGVPWFNTVFGRDGLLTAYQTLWVAPEISRGVLRFLAAHQAAEVDDFCDAEPGKILHEQRSSEMAMLGEVPFRKYYGSVDSTPLFVVLAAAFFRRTNDRDFLQKIWPNIVAALQWIETYGDIDGDLFVEYHQRSRQGLRNQGWKDSPDSVNNERGAIAEPPIALIEAQAYVYRAYLDGAILAGTLGMEDFADKLARRAAALREKVHDRFWDESLGCFSIALDGEKRPCRVKNSNAGHALFTGLAYPEVAKSLVETLLSPEMFSGWGIRTLASDAPRFNPLSYHNGSVWPHDTSLIALGMSRYGYRDAALRLVEGMFDAATLLPRFRLPELFCGFTRRDGEGPTAYPVACSPQAWAVTSVFALLEAALGLEIDAPARRVNLRGPVLPAVLQSLNISGLVIGDQRCDLGFHKYPEDVGVVVNGKPAGWELRIIK